MIQPKSRHQANVMDAIEDVFCAHHAMLATVTFLKEMVEALEEQQGPFRSHGRDGALQPLALARSDGH